MKKIVLTLGIVLSLTTLNSCKKETSTPTNSNTTKTDTNSSDVLITGFDCNNVIINGDVTKNQNVSNVTATINYTGGNGKSYATTTSNSSGLTGLTATLQAGTLAVGNGILTYNITGTPTTIGTANFAISLGGQTCSIKLTVKDAKPTSGYGPNVVDIDGNSYPTVYIGKQIWMAKNLKVTHYNDNTAIPNITDKTKWEEDTLGAYCNFNNNINVDNTYYGYGKLYNWYVVNMVANGNKNVCPTGWHVPTMAEWQELINFVGGENVAGKNLKTSIKYEWGTQSYLDPYLFSAVPSGRRTESGNFDNNGSNAYWWGSDSKLEEYGLLWGSNISIGYDYTKVYISKSILKSGFSIRCLKD